MNPQNEYHYPPVDDRAAKWGFYLTTAGRVLNPVASDLPYGVHPDMYVFDQDSAPRDSATLKSPRESGRILPEFQVAYITDTRAVFESDETGVVEFDGPTLLFLFPGVWHRYRSVGRDKKWLTTRWLGFNGDLAYRLMEQQFVTPETAIRPAARPRRLAAAFDRLIDRVASNPSADPTLLSMHAMELLANSIESAHDGKDGKDGKDGLVAQVLDLIWTGSHRALTMGQLCESVGANRRTVDRRFMAARGHSLLTEVNRCRCQRAQHFLSMTELPLKNVCWLTGFHNPKHMRVTFQQITGVTPSMYRERHQRRG